MAWRLPPEAERPSRFRCLVVVEVEWVPAEFPGQRSSFFRPVEHSGLPLVEGAPGVHGFLQMVEAADV